MALITFSDGTKRSVTPQSEVMVHIWLSPSTADSADTVVLPTITGKTPYIISAFDNTTGDSVTASISTQTVTIDASGGTTNHSYVLVYTYI